MCTPCPSVVSWVCTTSVLGILRSFLAWRFLWCTLECHVSRQKAGHRTLSSLPGFLGCKCATARCALGHQVRVQTVRRVSGETMGSRQSFTPHSVSGHWSLHSAAGWGHRWTNTFFLTSRILYSSWWDRDRQESEGFSYCVTMWNVLEAAGRDVEDEVRPSLKQQCLAAACRFLFTLALSSWGVWLQAQVFLFFRLWLALSGLPVSFSSLCYFCVTLLNDLNERREIVGGFYPYTFKRN